MALWTDIHCHIIPGVDDGTKDMKTAMELLRMEYDDGVRRIIVTPHFRRGMFETPWEKKPEDEIADENPRNMLKTDQITISIGEEIQRIAYVESITHDKDKAASLWQNIRIAGDEFDKDTPGVYEQIYYVVDSDGNMSNEETLTITVEQERKF